MGHQCNNQELRVFVVHDEELMIVEEEAIDVGTDENEAVIGKIIVLFEHDCGAIKTRDDKDQGNGTKQGIRGTPRLRSPSQLHLTEVSK